MGNHLRRLCEKLLAEKGTYILFFINKSDIKIKVGSLNEILFKKGIYLNVGSAFGLGGLKGRIQRHFNPQKKIFWHIDYLSINKSFKLVSIIEIHSSIKRECFTVNLLLNEKFPISKIDYIENFGSSDCQCKSHLLFFREISIQEVLKQIRSKLSNYKLKTTHF